MEKNIIESCGGVGAIGALASAITALSTGTLGLEVGPRREKGSCRTAIPYRNVTGNVRQAAGTSGLKSRPGLKVMVLRATGPRDNVRDMREYWRGTESD